MRAVAARRAHAFAALGVVARVGHAGSLAARFAHGKADNAFLAGRELGAHAIGETTVAERDP